jgi:hypothetical protein
MTDFNLLADLGNFATCSSERSKVSLDQVKDYIEFHSKRIELLKTEVRELAYQPYSEDNKVLISQKRKLLDEYCGYGMFDTLVTDCELIFKEKHSILNSSISFSKLCKYFATYYYGKKACSKKLSVAGVKFYNGVMQSLEGYNSKQVTRKQE